MHPPARMRLTGVLTGQTVPISPAALAVSNEKARGILIGMYCRLPRLSESPHPVEAANHRNGVAAHGFARWKWEIVMALAGGEPKRYLARRLGLSVAAIDLVLRQFYPEIGNNGHSRWNGKKKSHLRL